MCFTPGQCADHERIKKMREALEKISKFPSPEEDWNCRKVLREIRKVAKKGLE